MRHSARDSGVTSVTSSDLIDWRATGGLDLLAHLPLTAGEAPDPVLLRSILDDLHVEPRGESLKDLVDALHEFLLESRAKDRNVVLIIDEAQDLSAEVLEQVRLISNLETDTEKLIQIILMGQPELREIVELPELKQLKQRIVLRFHLYPLSEREAQASQQEKRDSQPARAIQAFQSLQFDQSRKHTNKP